MADAGLAQAGCRIDVWLWRARFFKTRALAARWVDEGRIRLTRPGRSGRVDKPSRTLREGDALVFAIGGRLVEVTVLSLGARRGPPTEARALYATLVPSPPDAPGDGIDKAPRRLTNTLAVLAGAQPSRQEPMR